MRFLITGGAGFLGINLCRYLRAKGHLVRSLDKAPFDYPDRGDYEVLQGDVRDNRLLKIAMEGVDAVVHTAAALPLYSEGEILSVDIEGTRRVLQAAKNAGVKRVIHVSSTAVYGIPAHHPLFENDRLQGVGPYGKAKIIAERVCLEFRKQGMIVPILRPKSFVGPERLGVFAIYFDWIHRGKNIPIVGWGHNRYQLLDVDDLCDAIWLCVIKPGSIVNDTFNIGAKEYTTMKEDFGIVLRYAGKGRRIVGTPPQLTIWTLRFLEALGLSPLYKWVYETAPHDSFVSIEKAERVLGFQPKFSNKQALIRNYQWYLSHRREFADRSGISHRVPWKQGILKAVSWFF